VLSEALALSLTQNAAHPWMVRRASGNSASGVIRGVFLRLATMQSPAPYSATRPGHMSVTREKLFAKQAFDNFVRRRHRHFRDDHHMLGAAHLSDLALIQEDT